MSKVVESKDNLIWFNNWTVLNKHQKLFRPINYNINRCYVNSDVTLGQYISDT